MDLTTVDPASPSRPWRLLRRRQVAALLAVAAASLLALWGTPSTTSEAYFGAELAGGGVSSWTVDSPRSSYGLEMATGLSVQTASDARGSSVVWVDNRGRLHRSRLDGLLSLADPAAPDDGNLDVPTSESVWDNGSQVDLPATIAATAAAGGFPAPPPDLGAARLLGLPLALLALAGVLVLIGGPQPRRRTKWGTFWMLGIPAGVGLVWWVLTDSPWSATTDALPAPGPRQRGPVPGVADRRGGGVMLLIAIALSAVVALAWLGLRLLPGLDDPVEPQQGDVTWHVVWSTGHTGELVE